MKTPMQVEAARRVKLAGMRLAPRAVPVREIPQTVVEFTHRGTVAVVREFGSPDEAAGHVRAMTRQHVPCKTYVTGSPELEAVLHPAPVVAVSESEKPVQPGHGLPGSDELFALPRGTRVSGPVIPREPVARAEPISITGGRAATLRATAERALRTTTYCEVGLSGCEFGCKIFARKVGSGVRFELWHSTTYGCTLGHDSATATVPVKVAFPPRVRARVVADTPMSRMAL